MTSSRMVTVDVLLIHETKDAYFVTLSEDEDGVWVPKSQASFNEDTDELTISEWMAIEKGLI